jgi:hypothetical protein
MPSDAPRSAYEIAMERLRQKDEEAGIERRPVTDAQKAAIADVRSLYDSKLAEAEIMHQGRITAIVDLAEREAHEAEYRRDRERLLADRDAKIEKLRNS